MTLSNITVRDANAVSRSMKTLEVAATHTPMSQRDWTGLQPQPFIRYLDTVGNGTGTKNAAVNYSGAPGVFKITPGTNEKFRIYAMQMMIRDTSCSNANNFGAITGPLTNGIEIDIAASDVSQVDLVDGVHIKDHIDLARLAGVDIVTGVYSSGDEYLSALFRFDLTGTLVRIENSASEDLRVTLNDDFSGLIDFRFVVYGYEEGTST